jgi:hypothetical protein
METHFDKLMHHLIGSGRGPLLSATDYHPPPLLTAADDSASENLKTSPSPQPNHVGRHVLVIANIFSTHRFGALFHGRRFNNARRLRYHQSTPTDYGMDHVKSRNKFPAASVEVCRPKQKRFQSKSRTFQSKDAKVWVQPHP